MGPLRAQSPGKIPRPLWIHKRKPISGLSCPALPADSRQPAPGLRHPKSPKDRQFERRKAAKRGGLQ